MQNTQELIEKIRHSSANAVNAIQQSQQLTHQAVGEADQAEAALDSIFQAIATINDMTYQIASAAEEQSSVSETVSGNLSKPAHWPTTSPGTPPARPTPARPCVRRRNVCSSCWDNSVSTDNFHALDSPPSGASPFTIRRHICLMAGKCSER